MIKTWKNIHVHNMQMDRNRCECWFVFTSELGILWQVRMVDMSWTIRPTGIGIEERVCTNPYRDDSLSDHFNKKSIIINPYIKQLTISVVQYLAFTF